MITSIEIINKMNEALVKFGVYTFEDKGPDEVMDLDEIIDILETLPATKAGEIIKDVSELNKYGHRLAETIATGLDHMNEDWFDEFLEISGVEY